jgi:type I restriction enzyme R subunit
MTEKDPPIFRPFNPDGEVRIYSRNLPHWRQPGATYAVTFRQDDSIPAKVLEEWLDVRNRWWLANGIQPAWLKSDFDRFVDAYRQIPPLVRQTFERHQARMLHEELAQCHGTCVLRNKETQQIVLDALQHFHSQRWWLGDAMIMPNHVHTLIQPYQNWELEVILESIKKWTSRRIGEWLRCHPEIQPVGPSHNRPRYWQQESYDHIVRDTEELAFWRDYISSNGSKAKLPPDEYRYHTAEWLDQFARSSYTEDNS